MTAALSQLEKRNAFVEENMGLVMGRYKSLNAYGGELEVVNLSPVAYRMMQLSGLQSLAKLSQKSLAREKEKEVTRA